MSNKAIGNRFEREMSKVLAENGFWCHVMQQNKAGQPADIIGVKGRYHVLIDCKEMSDDRFEFYRAEENQRLAMNRFEKRGGQVCWFALKLPDGEVRMLSYFHLLQREKEGKKSLGGKELMEYTVSLSAWLNYIQRWKATDGKRIGRRIKMSENIITRIKNIIPMDRSMCALIKPRTDSSPEEYFDAISNRWEVYKALVTITGHPDGDEDETVFMTIDPNGVEEMPVFHNEIELVPNYKCETCGNRMIPSIQKRENGEYAIHYRCPMCCQSCNFDYKNPTWRLRKDD